MERLSESEILAGVATKVWRKFRHYVAFEDLIAEGNLWLMEHPREVEKYYQEEEDRLAAWRLRRYLFRPLDRYARRERAATIGFDAGDEAYYTPTQIATMLPRVFSGDPFPDVTAQPEIRSPSDPAEGGDWMASYFDVSGAWSSSVLTATERQVLIEVYGHGHSQMAVADLLEVSQPTVSRTVERALSKLSDALGGSRSQGCPVDCECHDGRLRRRPGTHGNDAGRAQLLS